MTTFPSNHRKETESAAPIFGGNLAAGYGGGDSFP